MKTVDELTPEEFTLPPLHQAARQRDLRNLRKFLAEGHDVNTRCDINPETREGGNSPLWFAAQGQPGDNIPVARALLEAGADIDQPGEFNMTPLHMACSWGHADLVEFLVSHGARTDLTDDYGRTPATLAQQDYAEGLNLSPGNQTEGFHIWLSSMSRINAYFQQTER